MTINSNNYFDALPEGWTVDRLKDLVSLRNDKTAVASEEADYLELEDIESGTGRILNRRNTLEVESAVTKFKNGDVLFGKLRPYLEKFYQAEFDGKCTGEILAFKPERIESRFLFYCVASSWFIERCNMLAYGAKMPRVNWATQLAQFNLPLPSRSEQEQIAAYLDLSCAAIDTSVAAKRRQIDSLAAFRQSTITRLVTTGLDKPTTKRERAAPWFQEAPLHWRIERLKDVVLAFVDYRGKTPEKTREGIALITARNIKNGRIDFSESQEYISEDDYDAWMVRGFPQRGDVLITTEAPMGEVAQIEDARIALAQRIVLLKTRQSEMTNQYLRYYFLSSAGFTEIRRYATGSTALGIKARWLKVIRVIVPPVIEQNAIVRFLDHHCEQVEPLIRKLREQLETLNAYRKSLIHECVTGRRRVTDTDLKQIPVHV